jgi:hypothetical protein
MRTTGIAAVALALVTLAGCGDAATTSTDAAADVPPVSEAEPGAELAGVTFDVLRDPG